MLSCFLDPVLFKRGSYSTINVTGKINWCLRTVSSWNWNNL